MPLCILTMKLFTSYDVKSFTGRWPRGPWKRIGVATLIGAHVAPVRRPQAVGLLSQRHWRRGKRAATTTS